MWSKTDETLNVVQMLYKQHIYESVQNLPIFHPTDNVCADWQLALNTAPEREADEPSSKLLLK